MTCLPRPLHWSKSQDGLALFERVAKRNTEIRELADKGVGPGSIAVRLGVSRAVVLEVLGDMSANRVRRLSGGVGDG